MNELIQLLNEMKSRGIVLEYAVGGATALIYYFEPFQTQDVDVFVVLQSSGTRVSLDSIYRFFEERGAVPKVEHLVYRGIPVQFLLPYNALIEAAVSGSVEVPFEQERVRLMTLEHLMAIMVQTGRAKDRARLEEIYRLRLPHDEEKFQVLLRDYGLTKKWNRVRNSIALSDEDS